MSGKVEKNQILRTETIGQELNMPEKKEQIELDEEQEKILMKHNLHKV